MTVYLAAVCEIPQLKKELPKITKEAEAVVAEIAGFEQKNPPQE